MACREVEAIGIRVPSVSVIIPTHNRAKLLSRAVKSVLLQTYKDIEVIVVDDASDDATLEVVEEMISEDKRIRCIQLKTSLGGGGARNIGIKNALGNYISFLDDDDEWLPQKLERQLPFVDKYSVVGCLSSIAEGIRIFGLRMENRSIMENDFTKPQCTRELQLNDIFYNNGRLSPTTTLIRRTCLLKINGFDESLSGAQGRDLFIRLVKEFGPALMVEEKLAIHYQSHGLHRISDSPKRLNGYWKEFQKHSQAMPKVLFRWRKYQLCLKECKSAVGIVKIKWFFRSIINFNLFWPLRSMKLLFITFWVKR